MRLRRTLLRWPLRALEPSEPALPARYWIAVGALAALTLGWAALRMPGGVSMPLGLAMITIAAFVWTLAAARRRRRAPPPGHIEANDGGIHRVTPDGQTSLARWGSPFGVTLLACYDRSTALLAFTTPDHTAYWFELASDRATSRSPSTSATRRPTRRSPTSRRWPTSI